MSKSSVSREFVEQSGRGLKQLSERRFDGREFLVIHLDGVVSGKYHVLSDAGVNSKRKKGVLEMNGGASESGAATIALLEEFVERGIDPGQRYLFVIDGAKALRSTSDQSFGGRLPWPAPSRQKRLQHT